MGDRSEGQGPARHKTIKDGMEGGWLWGLPKMLTIGEDAHLKRMSAFGSDEHLRGNGTAGSSVFEHDDGLGIPKFLDRRAGLA